jgi:hypothetical protein
MKKMSRNFSMITLKDSDVEIQEIEALSRKLSA